MTRKKTPETGTGKGACIDELGCIVAIVANGIGLIDLLVLLRAFVKSIGCPSCWGIAEVTANSEKYRNALQHLEVSFTVPWA